jgi:hypothetical protein
MAPSFRLPFRQPAVIRNARRAHLKTGAAAPVRLPSRSA